MGTEGLKQRGGHRDRRSRISKSKGDEDGDAEDGVAMAMARVCAICSREASLDRKSVV